MSKALITSLVLGLIAAFGTIYLMDIYGLITSTPDGVAFYYTYIAHIFENDYRYVKLIAVGLMIAFSFLLVVTLSISLSKSQKFTGYLKSAFISFAIATSVAISFGVSGFLGRQLTATTNIALFISFIIFIFSNFLVFIVALKFKIKSS